MKPFSKISHLYIKVASCAFIAFSFAPHIGQAQLPNAATSTAAPDRAAQQFESPEYVPDVQNRVQVKDLILQDVPDGAEDITFQLNSITLDGVSVYNKEELRTVYADKIGATITLADLYGIAGELTNTYRNDGYILTQVIVPPQTIDGGDVTLRVVEGFIDTIGIEGGNDESGLDMVRYYASGIETGEALNVADLERYLLLISDLPGLEARSVLSPSKTKTGAADLAIIVTRDPYDAVISMDNYGSRYLGPLQFGAAGVLNSYFGMNEQITAQFVGAPDPSNDAPLEMELGYYALGYSQPIKGLGTGTEFEIFASYTDTEPGFDLQQNDVEGISKYISAQISHPFIRSRTKNLTGYALLDARNVDSRSNIQPTLKDRIRSIRAGGTFEFLDTLIGVGINGIGIEVSQGLGLLGASDEGDSNLSRGSGDPTYTKINANAQRLQRVTSNVNVLLAATGQLSNGALLTSEEFGVGGINFGRGYDPSEIIGDDGIAGKVEVQWNEPAKIEYLDDYQIFGFFDAGRVWNDDASTPALEQDTVTSTGIGLRTEFAGDIEADAFIALPLNRDVQTMGDQDPRFYFSLRKSF